jgi:hypothetical protein
LIEYAGINGNTHTTITIEHADFTDVWNCKLEAGSPIYSIDQ